jgi:murein DD-endopeptidase MepM/ murein hydrolase activator NlpD
MITFLDLHTFFLPESYYLSKNEEEMRKLNEKIIYLANEVEKLQIVNIKLKSIFEKQDSLNQLKINKDTVSKQKQGNILLAFYMLLDKLRNYQQQIIFIKPVDGVISNVFNAAKGHFGIDISAKENTPIYAAANGYISFAGYTPEYGNEIIIIHQNDFITKYKHCAVLVKSTGERVIQGELIALVGNTGMKSKGSHLHFEIWYKGKPVNPENYLLNF